MKSLVLSPARDRSDRVGLPGGLAATTAGLLCLARWIWWLLEGRLDHMAHSPTFADRYFFAVYLLMLVPLGALFVWYGRVYWLRHGLLTATLGFLWMGGARTIEAFGASGPWGFYASPGLVAACLGLLMAGISLIRDSHVRRCGALLSAISLLHFGGSFLSLLLFNLLGRTSQANWTGTVVGKSLLILESICWVLLGLALIRPAGRR